MNGKIGSVEKADAAPTERKLDLSKCRLKRGVSLEQIAEATKISTRFLKAIEDEEFEKLPGGIFNTSYLRQYAAAIGYEESKLLAHYGSKTGQSQEPAARVAEPERGRIGRFFRTAVG